VVGFPIAYRTVRAVSSSLNQVMLGARVRLKPGYHELRRLLTSALLERRLGIETARWTPLTELGLAHPERVSYEPSAWSTLRRILPPASVTHDDVFLDFGSGMGRVVFQAARYPFRRVIGVELAEQLHEVARANIEGNRDRLLCSEVELVCADALDYQVPDDVTVAYFYNPFRGATFAGVMDNLLASVDRQPRSLRVIYRTPEEHAYLLATGRFRVLRALKGRRPGREWSRTSSTILYEVLPSS
jgi:SAM-dependent methyltransferase